MTHFKLPLQVFEFFLIDIKSCSRWKSVPFFINIYFLVLRFERLRGDGDNQCNNFNRGNGSFKHQMFLNFY